MGLDLALASALVDRARLVTTEVTPVKVEGSTVLAPPVPGPWFKARLTVPKAAALAGAQGNPTGRRRVASQPNLILGVRALDGSPLPPITTDMRIQVASVTVGSTLTHPIEFDVAGDPEPIRKKRKVIGWDVNLKRVVDHQAPRLAS